MTWPARRLGSARDALQRVRRGPHLLANRTVIEGLVPVAGLVGVRVVTADGAEVGRVADVVVRWGAGSYPAVTGLVVRVGLRRAFVHVEQVAKLTAEGVRLESARVDLRDFARRPGEVLLARDVIDHQLVDVDDARVVRASDLYLAPVAGLSRLVGVDIGMRAFLRRVGPAAMRRRVSPERVIDWADVAPFSAPGAPVRLRTSHERLRELHPAELADLLEDLGRAERHELLTALAPETAADVLEEMEPDELTELLRDAPPGEAADLLVRMEPDEAVDALRELSDDDRVAILAAMPLETAAQLTGLLAYPRCVNLRWPRDDGLSRPHPGGVRTAGRQTRRTGPGISAAAHFPEPTILGIAAFSAGARAEERSAPLPSPRLSKDAGPRFRA